MIINLTAWYTTIIRVVHVFTVLLAIVRNSLLGTIVIWNTSLKSWCTYISRSTIYILINNMWGRIIIKITLSFSEVQHFKINYSSQVTIDS